MDLWKNNISFILIDTLETGNIGASARALKNLDFSNLELVRPRKFPSDEAGWFAHGASDILANVKVYPELAPALSEKAIVIGLTRRAGKKRGISYPVREGSEIIRKLSGNNKIALLFGKEDSGLSNKDTAECSFMITIPAAPENPSFNLAQAVLIVAYELSYASHPAKPLPAFVSDGELMNLYKRLLNLMEMTGYKPKGIRDNKEAILTDLKRLIKRATLTEREVHMLHGVMSQIEDSLAGKS